MQPCLSFLTYHKEMAVLMVQERETTFRQGAGGLEEATSHCGPALTIMPE